MKDHEREVFTQTEKRKYTRHAHCFKLIFQKIALILSSPSLTETAGQAWPDAH